MKTLFVSSLKEQLTYIRHGLFHLRKGTLIERLKAKWGKYIKNRRFAGWKSQISKRQYIEKRIQSGVKMYLYFDSKLCELIYKGEFERQEQQFINTFLKQGDIFVDIGANVGLFTLIAAHRVGKSGHVYAFEPCEKAYQRLLANVQLNRLTNTSCYQLALSDKKGHVNLKIPMDGYDAWSSLGYPYEGNAIKDETVQTVTWDDFAQEHDLVEKVIMMKIDVEGWEARVLSGGHKTLSRTDAPILQVEFTDQASQLAGTSCTELYHTLEKLGYKMFIYNVKERKLIQDPLRESYPYVNLIAAKSLGRIVSRLSKTPLVKNRSIVMTGGLEWDQK